MRILLVDDESPIHLNLKKILYSLGHSCDSFDDPLVALDHFNKDQYDVVISDVVLPAMNESESESKIRFVTPATKKILASSQFVEAVEAISSDCSSVVSMENPLILEQAYS